MAFQLGLSTDNKIRILSAIEVGKTIVQWGWVPAILFIGIQNTFPRPSFVRLISPLA